MATHELDEAQRVADHVLMFQSGQLLANAPMRELQDATGQKQTLEDIFRSLAEMSKSQGAP
jgi:ABC-type multidrug transport system ATPase subunit